ncbi:MAG: hypothetical protein WBD40_06735 [Tepidisphaeraceae bacterium]
MKKLALIVVAVGILVRVAGIFTDLWFDEIWSLKWGLYATSPVNLATVHRFKHDNNHLLNSAYIWLIGRQTYGPVYRLFSLACGLGMLPLAYMLGKANRWTSLMLVAGCFQLAFYSSEARGYIPAAFFALLAWLCIERFHEYGKWYDVLGFWAACILGLLAHLTFVYALAGFGLMSLRIGKVRDLLSLHTVPAAFTYALWQEFARNLKVGGGPETGPSDAILDYVHQLTGLSGDSTVWLWTALAVISLLVVAYAKRQEAWLLAGVLVTPALMLLVRNHYVYGRYFLLCTPFILICLARSQFEPRKAVVLITLWLTGQMVLLTEFVENGRGQYDVMVAYMADHGGGTVRTGQVKDFGDSTLMGYHAKGRVRYVYTDDPDWLVYFTLENSVGPEMLKGGRYGRVKIYPYRGFSGTTWTLYRRIDEGTQ